MRGIIRVFFFVFFLAGVGVGVDGRFRMMLVALQIKASKIADAPL